MKRLKKLGLGFLLLLMLGSSASLLTLLMPGQALALEQNQYDAAQHSVWFCTYNNVSDVNWRDDIDPSEHHRVEAYCNPANLAELTSIDPCGNGDSRNLPEDKYYIGDYFLADFCSTAGSINPETGATGGGSAIAADLRNPEGQAEALENDIAAGEGAQTPIDNMVRQLRSRAGCYQISSSIPVGAICNLSFEQTIDLCRSDDQLSMPQYSRAAEMCNQIRTWYGDDVFTVVEETPVEEIEETPPSCESAEGGLGWIICPVILATDSALNWLDTQIQGLLEVDESKYAHEDLKRAWSNIRNIAYAILVPIMLVMVIGTALGFEVFSAYTVKRALPRMVIAVIFISLSWYITTFLIGFFNVVGGGILGILTSPFTLDGQTVSTLSLADLFPADGGSFWHSFVANTAITLGMVVVIWLFLGPLVIIVLTAFLVLFLRQMFIVALSLLAPLAILSWIFPGNDKLWKMWWGAFSKLLMMFPLIMAVIAVGRIFAAILATPAFNDGGFDSFLTPLFILAAYILPYAFIPFTFKLAGGMFANLTGMMQDREKGVFARMKEKRGEKLGRAKQGNLFKGGNATNFRGRLNRAYERGANVGQAGLNPLKMRQRQNAALSNAAYDEAMEAREKNAHFKAISGNDDYLEAGMRSTDEKEIMAYLKSKNYNEDQQKEGAALVRAAQRSMSNSAFNMAAAVSNAGTGTGYGGGAGEMYEAINKAAGGDRAVANRMLADARGLADRARRPDLVASGFGTASKVMQQHYEGKKTTAQATADQDEQTLFTQDPRAIASAKPAMIKRLAPMMLQEVSQEIASGDQYRADRALAKYAALYDQMSHISPESAQALADGVMGAGVQEMSADGKTPTGRFITVREAVETARSRPPGAHGEQMFLELRREYGTRFAADQANAQITQQPPGQQGP